MACAHCHARRVPCGAEIVRQASEVRWHNGGFRPLHCLQPGLARFYSAKRRLPTLLKLRGDQAIVRIAGSVTPFRERSFISNLLQLELHNTLFFTSSFHVPPLGLHRRLDRHRLDGAEKLSGDRGVDPQTAEREAPGQSEHLVRTLTPIDRLSRRTARVTHHQVPPTAATG